MTIVNVNYANLDEVFGSGFNKKKKVNKRKQKIHQRTLLAITMLEDMIKL